MFDSVDLSASGSFLGSLRKLVRRARGTDRWPFAQACVVSCERVVESGSDGDRVFYQVNFTYADREGCEYSGNFSLPAYGTARLFAPGDKVFIQYNPQKPSQTAYSEAWSNDEPFWIGCVAVLALFLAHWLITGHLWFHSTSD